MTSSPQCPIRVLLIDDDEEDYLITRDLFADIPGNQFALHWVENYEQGLASVLAERHEIYLIDYRLGARTGLELIEEAHRQGSRTPMILLTGLKDHDVDLKAMHAGVADFLVKGQLNPEFLERSLRYALERKRSEEEIRKLAAFAHQNPNPVFELAADGTLVYCNAAAQKMADGLGRVTPAALLPKEAPAIVAGCLGSGQKGPPLQTTVDGRTLSWAFFPVTASGTVHCYASDMTDLLSLEAQLRQAQKMEAIGQLAAGVAHDFNNLLTVIQGHTGLLQSRLPPEMDAGRSLSKIALASDRASHLVKQLLTMSRKQVLQPEALDLNDVISRVLNMLHRILGEDIVLRALPAPNLPPVHADSGMIEQALMNLALNARDAMPKGGQLTISTAQLHLSEMQVRQHPHAKSGAFVCVTVADTGSGIKPELVCRIFDPFFTTKEPGKGTGLGLTTVYNIVQQHQGWVEVQSALGAGTSFNIYLPAELAREPLSSTQPLTFPPAAHGDETILLVEDETVVRELALEILRRHGYRVLTAGSGVEALEVWARQRDEVDLLLTDLVMPGGINGRELAERLRHDEPTLRVIYTSGYSPGIAGKDLTVMVGFNFLPKPYQPSKLAALVRESLDASPPPSPKISESATEVVTA